MDEAGMKRTEKERKKKKTKTVGDQSEWSDVRRGDKVGEGGKSK